jgi:subtilase family serine protease
MTLIQIHRFKKGLSVFVIGVLFPAACLHAQGRKVMGGHVHPLARQQNDRGPVDSSMKLSHLSVFLKKSPAQQADLDRLLENVQDIASPLYHQWLTPKQYADRFGAPPDHIDRITRWLESNGFSIVQVARGRDFIVFSGTTSQLEAALQTPIHRYAVDGEQHYANAAAPSVPDDLYPLIAGFRGLHDFRAKPLRLRSPFPPVKVSATKLRSHFRTSDYPGLNILAPDDIAAIYNINALYQAGVDGSGQTLAIVGTTDIDMSDIESFRDEFNLPFKNPRTILVPGSDYPGFDEGAMGEADLDLEWAGAVARNATIYYVYASDPFTSAFYVIDEALAPVLSFSFGICELHVSPDDMALLESEAQKAALEGITWLVSSGDSGASACEDQNGGFTSAITRLNPSVPASLPHVTGVGGSELNEGSGRYWSNSPGRNGGSALGYIPEAAWNDEDYIARNNASGFASSGGGASWFFSKPAWQTGPGVPNDGARDVPDVALTASGVHDPYALITAGSFVPTGGTSAAAPAFAGIVTLLNQYLTTTGAQRVPGLGDINPMLYGLAQNAPAAFHDITTGSNIVPCVIHSTQDCTTGSMGYRAGPGYDLVTGLGSVDAYNLALDWRGATSKSARLAITQFTTTTTAKVGGAFNLSLTIANEGVIDTGAFQTRIYFTTNGDVSTANGFVVNCDVKGIRAGASSTCSGTVNLGAAIAPGTYLMLAVADVNKSVAQTDRSAGFAMASTGPVTVTR